MVKSAMKLDYEDRIFQAKIRGYEIQEDPEVKPMKEEEWDLVLKEIKKKQLDFERNKDIIKLRQQRYV